MFQKIRRVLDGKKTYLGMIAGGTLGLLWSYGLLDDQTVKIIAALIVTFTGVSLRAAVSKGQKTMTTIQGNQERALSAVNKVRNSRPKSPR